MVSFFNCVSSAFNRISDSWILSHNKLISSAPAALGGVLAGRSFKVNSAMILSLSDRLRGLRCAEGLSWTLCKLVLLVVGVGEDLMVFPELERVDGVVELDDETKLVLFCSL